MVRCVMVRELTKIKVKVCVYWLSGSQRFFDGLISDCSFCRDVFCRSFSLCVTGTRWSGWRRALLQTHSCMARDGLGAALGQSDRDRTRLFIVGIKRISCRELTGGHAWLFHPVSIRNLQNQRTGYACLAGHALEMRKRPMMHLWTGAFLNERRWGVTGRWCHLPVSISSASMLLRASG